VVGVRLRVLKNPLVLIDSADCCNDNFRPMDHTSSFHLIPDVVMQGMPNLPSTGYPHRLVKLLDCLIGVVRVLRSETPRPLESYPTT